MHRLVVALVANRLTVGGLERVVAALARGLDPAAFDVRVVCLADGGAIADHLARSGTDVTILDGRASLGPRGLLATARCVPRLTAWMRAVRPDVVQTHLFYAMVLGGLAARRAGAPALVHVEQNFYHWKGRLAAWLERRALGDHGRVVTPTRVLALHHGCRLGLDPARFAVIPNGVRPFPAGARAAARDSLGFSADHVLVGLAERLVAAKRQDVFLEAARLAAAADARLRFVLVGDGPEARRVAELARQGALHGRVVLTGALDAALPAIAALDIYATASTMEGFGIAPVEALASGVPVVAPSTPVLEEVLGPSGAAILVTPGSPAALARGILALARDAHLRARLGEAGRRHAAGRFDGSRMVDAYAALYRDLVSLCAVGRSR